MRDTNQSGTRVVGHDLSPGVVDVLFAAFRDSRPLLREARRPPTVDRQDLVLPGLDVPHADHGDQPTTLFTCQVRGLCVVLIQVVKLPAFLIKLDQLVVVNWRPKRQPGLSEGGAGPRAHRTPTIVIKRTMPEHLKVLSDVK